MIRFQKGIVIIYVTAVVVLIGGAIGFRSLIRGLDYHMMKKPVKLRLALDGIPSTLGEWKQVGKDAVYGSAEIESLGTETVLTRTYVREGSKRKEAIELHIAYYTGKIDDVPHVPERCWATSGLLQTISPEHLELDVGTMWERNETPIHKGSGEPYPFIQRLHPVTGASETVYMPVGDFLVRATEFQNEKKPTERLVGGYFFIANGRITPSAFGVRGLAFNRTDEYAYYCKVQLNFIGIAEEDREVFSAFIPVATNFIDHLLPELMARLPEWPAYDEMGSNTKS